MARKPLHVYSLDPAWSDVIPIPQDDGGPNALATIAYTNEYRETSSYLRAVMAAQEHSPRVLDLTAHLIELNPAHYTVWYASPTSGAHVGQSKTKNKTFLFRRC